MLPYIFSVSTIVDVLIFHSFFCTPSETHAKELQISLTSFSFYQLYIISSIACVISATHNPTTGVVKIQISILTKLALGARSRSLFDLD